MRAPSSLYSSDASPSSVSASPTSGGRLGQHRLDGLERPKDELRQAPRRRRRARPRATDAEVAGEHRRAADAAGRHAGGARDRVDQDAFERALAQLAEQQPDEEILLVARRAAEQLAQQRGARVGRSGAGERRDAFEGGVDFDESSDGASAGGTSRIPESSGAANLHPPLARLAAQERR